MICLLERHLVSRLEVRFGDLCVDAFVNQVWASLYAGQPQKAIQLGETEVPEDIFMELLHELAPRFAENKYHLVTCNGNSFTNEVANLLLGEGIPKKYAELPREFF